jgi:hypothetical protein
LVCGVLSLAAGSIVFFQFPIQKMPTDHAMTMIEKDYVRPEKREEDLYKFFVSSIRANDRKLNACFNWAWLVGSIGLNLAGVAFLSTAGWVRRLGRSSVTEQSKPGSS